MADSLHTAEKRAERVHPGPSMVRMKRFLLGGYWTLLVCLPQLLSHSWLDSSVPCWPKSGSSSGRLPQPGTYPLRSSQRELLCGCHSPAPRGSAVPPAPASPAPALCISVTPNSPPGFPECNTGRILVHAALFFQQL